MSKPTPVRYWIGIDPGEHTGLAVWDNQLKVFDYVATMTFWEAVAYIEGLHEIGYTDDCGRPHLGFAFVLELPQLNRRTVYKKLNTVKEAQKREKIAGNIGQNRGDAQRLKEKIEMLGLLLVTVQPKSHKASAEDVKAVTGYDGKSNNEHVRDAIMHAYRECQRRGGKWYDDRR